MKGAAVPDQHVAWLHCGAQDYGIGVVVDIGHDRTFVARVFVVLCGIGKIGRAINRAFGMRALVKAQRGFEWNGIERRPAVDNFCVPAMGNRPDPDAMVSEALLLPASLISRKS